MHGRCLNLRPRRDKTALNLRLTSCKIETAEVYHCLTLSKVCWFTVHDFHVNMLALLLSFGVTYQGCTKSQSNDLPFETTQLIKCIRLKIYWITALDIHILDDWNISIILMNFDGGQYFPAISERFWRLTYKSAHRVQPTIVPAVNLQSSASIFFFPILDDVVLY